MRLVEQSESFLHHIHTLPKFVEGRRKVDGMIPVDGPMMVLDAQKELTSALTLWTYLSTIYPNFARESVDTLLDAEGKLIYKLPLESIEQALDDDPEKFFNTVKPLFAPLYAPVQAMLDSTAKNKKHGFNDHQFESHICTVARNVLDLYATARKYGQSITNREINLTIVGILLHDAGNAIDRGLHPIGSNREFEVMTNLSVDDPRNPFQYAQVVAIGHDEKVVGAHSIHATKELVEKLLKQEGTPNTPENFARRFFVEYEKICPRGVAFGQIGDKIHIGPDRLENNHELTPQALIDDDHFLGNLLCSKVSTEMTDEEYIVHISFSRYPKGEAAQKLKNLTEERRENGGRKFIVTPDMEKISNTYSSDIEPGRKHSRRTLMVQWAQKLHVIYKDRFELIALQAMTQFPHLRRVKFHFKEDESGVFENEDKVQQGYLECSRNRAFDDLKKPIRFVDIPFLKQRELRGMPVSQRYAIGAFASV